jgi:O-antigen/teichoic acid export membrane protein
MVALTIVPMVLLGSVLAHYWFKPIATFPVIVVLVASEVVTVRMVFLAEQAAIAHHQTMAANANRVFATMVRLSTICFAVFIMRIETATEWSVFAFWMAIISAGGALAMTLARFGAPDLGAPLRSSVHMGAQFSLMQIVRALQFSADKLAVGWLGSPGTVGAFGIASRFAQLGMLPAIAVTRITYPTFFAKGAQGLPVALGFAMRILPAIIGIGLLATGGVASLVWVVPTLFGSEFAEAKPFILLLACLPLLAGLQNVAGDTLSGSDRQPERLRAGVIGLALLVAAVLAGASFGVMGAVIGYMIGQLLFTLVSWSAVLMGRGTA